MTRAMLRAGLVFISLVCCSLHAVAELLRSEPAIELLKLQHENSDCVDLRELIEWHRTYNISHALQHASDFFTVHEDPTSTDNKYKVRYTCEQVFRGKEEKKGIWPPLSKAQLEQTNKQYLDDLCLNDSGCYISNLYFAQKQNDGEGYVWPEKQLEDLAKQPSSCGPYGLDMCEIAVNKYKSFVEGKVGTVVGSQTPWAEALMFRYGAKKVITYEYMKIETTHPKLVTMTPSEAAAIYLSGKWEPMDFVFTFSSLEHDGLGRYGDPLNAFGDLETIAKIHCMLKPNGILFFGVPVGFDEIQFNAHRLYGYRRLSVIMSLGFRMIDLVSYHKFKIYKYNSYWEQPVMVMQKHELH